MTTQYAEVSAVAPRPSLLIAEALVHRHDCEEVKVRAQEMGLSDSLIEAVLSVCRCEIPVQDPQRALPEHD